MYHLVIGASLKPDRASYSAIQKLVDRGFEVRAIGLREGTVAGVRINTEQPEFKGVDTVLMYVNPDRQIDFFDYLVAMQPKRVLFNPGTENPEFEEALRAKGMETIESCALVMLSTGKY